MLYNFQKYYKHTTKKAAAVVLLVVLVLQTFSTFFFSLNIPLTYSMPYCFSLDTLLYTQMKNHIFGMGRYTEEEEKNVSGCIAFLGCVWLGLSMHIKLAFGTSRESGMENEMKPRQTKPATFLLREYVRFFRLAGDMYIYAYYKVIFAK